MRRILPVETKSLANPPIARDDTRDGTRDDARAMLKYLREQKSAMVRLLEKFVRCESPTDVKAAVDKFGRLLASEWQKRGTRVSFVRQKSAGDHLRVVWPASRSARPTRQILVLGHMDTVYELETLPTMPFRSAKGRVYGPGIFDMKGGLAIALFAVDSLIKTKRLPAKQVVFLWTSDEETGSATSRALIEKEARRSCAVLVLEPAAGPNGALKTERKGVGTVALTVSGKASHAGLNPQDGINAVHEIALQIERLAKFNDSHLGITVSPTIVSGGTRSNVIPAAAELVVDVRANRVSDMRNLERHLHLLKPILKGAKLHVSGGFSRPPLERTASASLFEHAQKCARVLGFDLTETSAGGGSDGNFTAALGIPTLDGLGAVGEAPHSSGENVIIEKLPERAALLASLLATI